MKQTSDIFPDSPFWTQYRGRFFGILNWPDVDRFWNDMSAHNGGWYVFDPSEPAPEQPATAEDWRNVLGQARDMINSRRDLSHCGAVYLDNPENPSMVKIFDPAAMGSSCSISTAPILPRWIFSRSRPESLPPTPEPEKPTILQRITGRT